MSITLQYEVMSEHEAETLTAQIVDRLDQVVGNIEVVRSLMRDALTRRAHEALGYASPGAYMRDRFEGALADLSAALRREIVHELSDAGMSTRAIAPIVGVAHKTVARDLEPPVSYDTPDSTGGVEEVPAPVEHPPAPGAGTVNPITGEVLDGPVTTEHTVTEKVRTVVGLDGKEYKPKPKPKPVPTGEEAELRNAEDLCFNLGRSLVNLEGLLYDQHRDRIIRDWPKGQFAATPDARSLANPASFRAIAVALNRLADEWENSNG